MEDISSHRFGKVPLEYQRQDIHWIRIVPGNPPDSGVFIWLLQSLPDVGLYDDWCETMELALARAEKSYGVKESDLMIADEVRALGIKFDGD